MILSQGNLRGFAEFFDLGSGRFPHLLSSSQCGGRLSGSHWNHWGQRVSAEVIQHSGDSLHTTFKNDLLALSIRHRDSRFTSFPHLLLIILGEAQSGLVSFDLLLTSTFWWEVASWRWEFEFFQLQHEWGVTTLHTFRENLTPSPLPLHVKWSSFATQFLE
jgi:hypothetical protein